MDLEKMEEARDVFLMVLGNDDTCEDAWEGLKKCEETIEEDGIMASFRDLFLWIKSEYYVDRLETMLHQNNAI